MKHSLLLIATLAVLPFTAQAHKAWLLPSQTVITGQSAWITVDAAVSNDLFYFNHVPLRLDTLVITAPNGNHEQPQNPTTSKYRSVFDVELSQQGTYRLSVVNNGLSATWTENGQIKRWRGDTARFATEVPKNNQNLKVTQSLARIETFITNGNPNQTALEPNGHGLELVPITHPNDLFANEAAQFSLHIDGKPATGLEVHIIRGATRYRNSQDEIKVTTDTQGGFSVIWPQAGMYLLEVTTEDTKVNMPPAKQRRLSYTATLEVLPQ
ncbi:DUF4198 domain-containing protein [Xylella taiwanensis]|uniref:ABC transporter permease n=1 Tax=Xylella taiwanensis TaxID=1444770 RepID=Z9JMT6_9GAMM|nr:DUF4198 domain-containing protein [Xylella taiwanensis]AXI84047.1 ABC transporter permease [Xylella taiwanensis]EWS79032.1 ABC transporter permease [Xylella taiwanensis]MCD8457161.1 DUF4198 domain-containing protein [Xylella taiwanensis]MCD8459569.1 DUF4198 domain-containing protein [Xylella taiwanensis]MCD8461563.1 DUF4198 domain-containing protein [Xylella taiwanensis]